MLPLSEDAEAEKEDDLFNMDDVRIEVMRARGAGGQVRTCPAPTAAPSSPAR